MMTPTARSITEPFNAKSRNSFRIDIGELEQVRLASAHQLASAPTSPPSFGATLRVRLRFESIAMIGLARHNNGKFLNRARKRSAP
jgi:hypothetical protein